MKRQYKNWWISHTGRIFEDRLMEHEIELRISSSGYRMLERELFSAVIMRLFGPAKPYPKARILHSDGNKLNDHLSNLRWGKPRGPSSKPKGKPVLVYRDGVLQDRIASAYRLAKLLGVSMPTARHIARAGRTVDGRTYRYEASGAGLFE